MCRWILRVRIWANLIVAGAGLALAPSNLLAQQRHALVIGNSNYANVAKLRNPVNDATDIAAKLKALKFNVVLVPDADRALMQARLIAFTNRITDKDIALVFYAGHGVTVNGESYLLPVDVPATLRMPDGSDQGGNPLDDHLIGFSKVLAPLEAAKIGIVFLDACRTSSAKDALGLQLVLGNSRSIPIQRGNGTLPVKPSPHSAGVFRAYATQLNNVADDGNGRNSPFTRALLLHLGTPGISIQELMIRVRRSVMEETNKRQIPWEEAALNESFAFTPISASSSPRPQQPARAPAASAPAQAVRPPQASAQQSAPPAKKMLILP